MDHKWSTWDLFNFYVRIHYIIQVNKIVVHEVPLAYFSLWCLVLNEAREIIVVYTFISQELMEFIYFFM